MSGGEWIELGSVPRRYRSTWWRTLWDTAGARFWCSIGVAFVVTLTGVFLDLLFVTAVGIGAAFLLTVMWLAVTTSEFVRHWKSI